MQDEPLIIRIHNDELPPDSYYEALVKDLGRGRHSATIPTRFRHDFDVVLMKAENAGMYVRMYGSDVLPTRLRV